MHRQATTTTVTLRQGQLAVGGGGRALHAHLGQGRLQALAQACVLGHGKAMASGQGQHKLVGVKGLQGSLKQKPPGLCTD